MPIGTQDNPLRSPSFAVAAHAALRELFTHESGHRSLLHWRGNWYHWDNHRWHRRDDRWLHLLLLRELENAQVLQVSQSGATSYEPWKPNLNKVREVAACMEAHSVVDTRVPGLVGRPSERDQWCISFQDEVLCVQDGDLDIFTRTPDWFDLVVVPCDFDLHAQCPVWHRCLDQWSGGDSAWISLLQRWMGYCLLPTRRYARWALLKGVPRGGKGTVARVIQSLVGEEAFKGTSLYTLATTHGLMGLEQARVLSINEASDLESRDGERASHVIKAILGGDPIDINPKNKDILRNVQIEAAIMMQSNQMVRLPNRGRGLSDKMVVLPFKHSFVGHENLCLEDELRAEIPGIARWAVEGARQLASSDPGSWFPLTSEGLAEIQEYTLANNPVDRFLEARFVPHQSGFVSTAVLWREFRDWREINEVRTISTSRDQFTRHLRAESSWYLEHHRSTGGIRGLKGLALRKEAVRDDDV